LRITRHHKSKNQLLEAYGLPADTLDDLAVATLAPNDPLHRTWLQVLERGAMARRLLPAVLFLRGDTDENVLYQKHPVALAELLKSYDAAYTFQTTLVWDMPPMTWARPRRGP
jgi:hypothetical protein